MFWCAKNSKIEEGKTDMNDRIARVLANMEKARLDQILVSAPASIKYLTGLQVGPGERLCALLINSNGQVTLHANRLFALEKGADFDLVEHDDTDDCIGVLERDVRPGRLGVDKVWPSGFAVRLMDKRPDVKLALGGAPWDERPRCKTPESMEKMPLTLFLKHTSDPTKLRRIPIAVFCLKKKNIHLT